ncbi:hypothetical protein BX265_2339 [Streptomyces sp. TLI_235]|nr:hypothetical protein [Streptomyces sp. TLI_235]PBC77588.1 hypothetical protein BX265_2339 [Streptomyces sp. TLI_235]
MTTTTQQAGIVDLVITRRLSPPSHIVLRPEHLPAPVADAFATVAQALGAEREAQQAADLARGSKAEAAAADAARAEVDQAVNALAELTAASGTAIADSAGAAYIRALANAQAAIREAGAQLEEAQHAIALARRVQPGRPVLNLNLDGRGLREHPGWQRLSAARQQLRHAAENVQGGVL